MIGNFAVFQRRALAQADFFRRDQFFDQLAVMDDFVITAELRIFVLDRVETMRAGGHYLLDVVVVHAFDGFRRQLLGEKFMSQAPRRIAGARFFFTEDGELQPSGLQDARQRDGDLLVARDERANATDEEQIINGLTPGGNVFHLRYRRGHFFRPRRTFHRHRLIRIAEAFEAVKDRLHFRREGVLLGDQIAPQVDDHRHVFDMHRTLFHTGATGGAIPDLFFRHHAADQLALRTAAVLEATRIHALA